MLHRLLRRSPCSSWTQLAAFTKPSFPKPPHWPTAAAAAASPGHRHAALAVSPPPPPRRALLAAHPHPAVAEFPCAGFFRLADQPLLARAIHGLAIRLALPLSAFHRNTLLAFYFRHRDAPSAALHQFDEMPDRTPSSWYTTVSGCGHDATAFDLLRGVH
ncbi:hypothetical protein E2562_024304 [Oryza meyeriana var. granulata]|uniref:Pentatricopeptide repeat-containing protein n=1 Tax=Oryza meyeriana var. granulata TaxID=110450 RepID=A0A6G1C6Z2_9ORYZ|nr:hypothetical protein E2562_024304 [Oryza meyeriana var. granulata]